MDLLYFSVQMMQDVDFSCGGSSITVDIVILSGGVFGMKIGDAVVDFLSFRGDDVALAESSGGKPPNSGERSSEEFGIKIFSNGSGTKTGAVGGAVLSFREDVKDGVALAESSGVKRTEPLCGSKCFLDSLSLATEGCSVEDPKGPPTTNVIIFITLCSNRTICLCFYDKNINFRSRIENNFNHYVVKRFEPP